MPSREFNKLETRQFRVGGELSEYLGTLKEIIPEEYPAMLELGRTLNDEMRRIRHLLEERDRLGKG
jgi:hypothetical protein